MSKPLNHHSTATHENTSSRTAVSRFDMQLANTMEKPLRDSSPRGYHRELAGEALRLVKGIVSTCIHSYREW
jgi:hypothetical protein